jgi:hypothetical protein
MDKLTPDPFSWHEALDRSLLAFEFFSERVAQHPVVELTPELKHEADMIADKMFRLYQSLGERISVNENLRNEEVGGAHPTANQ